MVDLNAESRHDHAIKIPAAMADPLMTDPSLMVACWKASDELMPSGD